MTTPPDEPVLTPAPAPRAARLLEVVRMTLNHDLPSHLVAVLGLLHFLEQDEGPRLGPLGHDYLRRIEAATQRAQTLVVQLRDLCRLTADAGPAEAIPLDEVIGEARAAANQLFPQQNLVYHVNLEAPSVLAPRRALYQTFLQMLRLLLTTTGPGPAQVECRSRVTAAGVELTLRLSQRTSPGPPAAGPAAAGPAALARRLDVVFARELADSAGGCLTVTPARDGGLRLTLIMPAPQEVDLSRRHP